MYFLTLAINIKLIYVFFLNIFHFENRKSFNKRHSFLFVYTNYYFIQSNQSCKIKKIKPRTNRRKITNKLIFYKRNKFFQSVWEILCFVWWEENWYFRGKENKKHWAGLYYNNLLLILWTREIFFLFLQNINSFFVLSNEKKKSYLTYSFY